MSWSQSAAGFAELMQKQSPEYRKEQKWKSEAKEMERQKFAELMKEKRRAAERHAVEMQAAELEGDAKKRKAEFQQDYDKHMEMISDTEDFLADTTLSQSERMGRLEKLAGKYKGIPEFDEAIAKGSTAPMMRTATDMERFGLQREFIKSGPERKQVVDISGNLSTLPKGSPMYQREVTDNEKVIMEKFGQFKFGSPEFREAVSLQEEGMFDKISVRGPNGMPVEMPRIQAEAQGLMTEAQYKHIENEKTKTEVEKAADKERRTSMRKTQVQGEGVRIEAGAALDTARKAMQMLVVESQGPQEGSWLPDSVHQGVTGALRPEVTGSGLYSRGMQALGVNEKRDVMEGYLQQLKGFTGLRKMLELKSTSPTGSTGFGALNKEELGVLTGIFGSLEEIRNDPQSLYSTLQELEGLMEKVTSSYIPGDVETTQDGQQMMFMGGDPNDIENWEVY
jgi:hypothetical protein